MTSPSIDELERQVLDAIDFEGLLSCLCRLIEIPSLDGQESAAQQAVAQEMERCGLDIDVWELDFDALRRHPAYCEEVQRDRGLGVVGTLGSDAGGRRLILNGHVDVVPPGNPANWSVPPWRGTLTDNRVYGRGAVDMKGGLCCALFAAKALRDCGVALQGQLIVESVIGEEDGGVGTLAAAIRGYRADGAVIMEPTELAVVPVQAGALNFRLTVPGLSAHGCVRNQGVSAIEKFQLLLAALQALERRRNERLIHPLLGHHSLPYPLSIGTLRAGEWASTVPEELVCEGRYGVALGEELQEAQSEFEAAVRKAADTDEWLSDHPPQVDWWGGRFEPAQTALEEPIVPTVVSSLQDLTGSAPHIRGVTYGSDMRLLVNEAKTPTVLFGPGDVRQSHRPDEFVPIDDLLLAVRALALVCVRFCST
jgi:acetylornithine deacetylase